MSHTCVKCAFYALFIIIMRSKHCVEKYNMFMEVDLRLLCTSLVVAAIIYREVNCIKLEVLQTLLQLYNIRGKNMHIYRFIVVQKRWETRA